MASKLILEAKRRQLELAGRVDLRPLNSTPELIAGADISFNLKEEIVYAAMVVLRFRSDSALLVSGQPEVLEKVHAIEKVSFPYVPGFLSFREVPPLLAAWRKLKIKPQIVMLDGHGIIHPRRFGLACHFGLEAGVATMGCAKKPFVGRFEVPETIQGSFSPVYVDDEHRGFAWRSRTRVKPVYISPGTGTSLEDCLRIARLTTGKYRLLEPTRLAHLYSNEVRIQCIA